MTPRSRLGLGGAGILVVAVGILAKLVVPGLTGDLLGSACYTALLMVLLALVAPRSPGSRLALLAFSVSAAVEVLQLTTLPDAAARVVPLSSWVLGSTFAATDLLGYAAGALVGCALDIGLRRFGLLGVGGRRRRRRPRRRGAAIQYGESGREGS